MHVEKGGNLTIEKSTFIDNFSFGRGSVLFVED